VNEEDIAGCKDDWISTFGLKNAISVYNRVFWTWRNIKEHAILYENFRGGKRL